MSFFFIQIPQTAGYHYNNPLQDLFITIMKYQKEIKKGVIQKNNLMNWTK